MIKLVEQADGSTAVVCRNSNSVLSVIPKTTKLSSLVPRSLISINNNVLNRKPFQLSPSSSSTSNSNITMKSTIIPTSGDSRQLLSSVKRITTIRIETEDQTKPVSNCNNNQQNQLLAQIKGSTNSVHDNTEPKPAASGRTFRPRGVTEYNEDKAFQNLVERHLNSSEVITVPDKPDHQVITHKVHRENGVSSPNRIRTMPNKTLNIIRQIEPTEPPQVGVDRMSRDSFAKHLNLVPKKDLERVGTKELERSWPLRLQARTVLAKDRSYYLEDSRNQDEVDFLDRKPSELRSPQNNRISAFQWLHELRSRIKDDKPEPQVIVKEPNGVLVLKRAAEVLGQSDLLEPFQSSALASPSSSQQVRSQNTFDNKRLGVLERSGHVNQFVQMFTQYIEFSSNLGKFYTDLHPYVKLSLEKKRKRVQYHHEERTRGPLDPRWLETEQAGFGVSPESSLSVRAVKTRSRRTVNLNGKTTATVTTCSSHVHSYAFTKQERLEKYFTLDSGLDWRGRLLALHCTPLSISVRKMQRCPSCKEKLVKGHSCVRKADKEQVAPPRPTGNGQGPPRPPPTAIGKRPLSAETPTVLIKKPRIQDVPSSQNRQSSGPRQEPRTGPLFGISPKTCCINCAKFDCLGQCLQPSLGQQQRATTQSARKSFSPTNSSNRPGLRSRRAPEPAVAPNQPKMAPQKVNQQVDLASHVPVDHGSYTLVFEGSQRTESQVNDSPRSQQQLNSLRQEVTNGSEKTKQSDATSGLRRAVSTYNIRSPVTFPLNEKNDHFSDEGEEVIFVGSNTIQPSLTIRSGHVVDPWARGSKYLSGQASFLNSIKNNISKKMSTNVIYDQKSNIVIEGLE
ncbi:hypothetical protein HDE_02211 [Halotydeus destructor]|nr:hypothetical protein HDE_02211 [Halotydeus destructor]